MTEPQPDEEVVIHPIEPAQADLVPITPADDLPDDLELEEVGPSNGGLGLTDPILEFLTDPKL
ncbi:hypothetical protein [Corynebacterium sp. CCM 9203]|uniref:hypothetical protein n=1 Tax=Corynebacterium sp. CCM 9203 TaxID=3057615 RepID=UPI003523E530